MLVNRKGVFSVSLCRSDGPSRKIWHPPFPSGPGPAGLEFDLPPNSSTETTPQYILKIHYAERAGGTPVDSGGPPPHHN